MSPSTSDYISDTLVKADSLLGEVFDMVSGVQDDLASSIGPLYERTMTVQVNQRDNPYTPKEALPTLYRDKGDIIIHRDEFLLTTLDLETLLQDADAAELHKYAGRPLRPAHCIGYVQCRHPDVMKFFGELIKTNTPDHVQLEVKSVDKETQQRVYGFSSETFSTSNEMRLRYQTDFPYGVMLESDIKTVVSKVKWVKNILAQLDKKRLRIVEEEQRWVEEPALKKAKHCH